MNTDQRIADIASVRTGIYAKPAISGVARYLQVRDFDEFGRLDARVKPQLTLKGELERHLLAEGEILFAAKGTYNFATVYEASMGPAVASSSFLVITIANSLRGSVRPDFLAWLINSPRSQAFLKTKAKGSTPPSITRGGLEELPVAIPSLEAQASILAISNLRTQEKRLVAELEELRQVLVDNQLTKFLEEQRG